MPKKIFLKMFLLATCALSVIFFSCSEKETLNEPQSQIVENFSSQQILAKQVETSYFIKTGPLDGSTDHGGVQYFSWAPAKSSFTDLSGRFYTFSFLKLYVDGFGEYTSYSYSTTGCVTDLPTDYNWHTWQVKAYYTYSGGTHVVPYDGGAEWDVQIGLPAPTLNIQISNNHPNLYWNNIPNSLTYLIFRSFDPNGTFNQIATTTSTFYIDSELTCTNPTNRTVYYKVAAWAQGSISQFMSPTSNMVSVGVN